MSNYQYCKERLIKKYDIPKDVKRGMRVRLIPWSEGDAPVTGRITGFDGQVKVRWDGMRWSKPVHCLDLVYGDEPVEVARARLPRLNERIRLFNERLNR